MHYRSVLGNLIPTRSTCFIAQLLESRALLNPVCWTNQHSTDVRQVYTLEINRREITAHSPVRSLKKQNKTSLFLEDPSELFVQTAFKVLQ